MAQIVVMLLQEDEKESVLVTQSVSDSLRPPWTVACQSPLSMGFSRQEYWSGLSFTSQGHLPYPGVKLRSPALQADSLPSELPVWIGIPKLIAMYSLNVYIFILICQSYLNKLGSKRKKKKCPVPDFTGIPPLKSHFFGFNISLPRDTGY